MRLICALLVLAACARFGTAQESRPQPKPADKAPGKGDQPEPVAGRKVKTIEGFTFYLDGKSVRADAAKYERPPLEVLEFECKLLTKMFSPKAVELLRTLPIFVDWDEAVALRNGRAGTALASYYPLTPQQAVRKGMHPLQAKGVTIHSLKSLTEQRQPKDDASTSCLLLHELAHAVHDQMFGYDHGGIKAAYEQAMERKLYEKDFYAATNHKEFFAEMTCAYLDRLEYYPHNRADLKKHDPVTFKTLEVVWAGAGSSGSKAAKVPLPHSEKRSMAVALPGDVKFGPTLSGPEPAADKLAGTVVLLGYWGGDFTNVLTRLDRLHDELADYGLVVIAAHAYVQEPAAIKATAESREARVTVVKAAYVKPDAGAEFESQPGGHALLFDRTGKCTYRGSAYDMDDAVRAAVGKQLLNAALGGAAAPAAFKPVADAFAAGTGPVAVYPKLVYLMNSGDPDTEAAAKKLAELILAPGQKALTDAQDGAKAAPVGSFLAAERVAARFKNTPLAGKAATLVANLRANKEVAAELKARAVLVQVEQVGTKLRGQAGGFDPTSEDFQGNNKVLLDRLRALLAQLREKHPQAHATGDAEKIAREFKIP